MTPSPMLLQEACNYMDVIEDEHNFFMQPKLNGWRAVIDTTTGRIYSRKNTYIDLPHITIDILTRKANGEKFPQYLDGELYTHGFQLYEIQSMIKKADARINFNFFDVMESGNYSERKKIVDSIPESAKIKKVRTDYVYYQDMIEVYRGYLSKGYEGAVIRFDKPYINKRSANILKLKPWYD